MTPVKIRISNGHLRVAVFISPKRAAGVSCSACSRLASADSEADEPATNRLRPICVRHKIPDGSENKGQTPVLATQALVQHIHQCRMSFCLAG